MNLSRSVTNLQPSGIRAFFDLVLGMKEIISLGVGEPDFTTPWNVREAAIYALEQGETSYTSNKGLASLRSQVSRHLKNKYGLAYDPDDEILITVGVSEAYDLAMRAILNPKDRVIVPEPCYVSYAPVIEMAGGRAVYLKVKGQRWKVKGEDIAHVAKRSKAGAIVLNYPSNPTGASYRKEELAEIAHVCRGRDLVVISDEIYDELTYDFAHTPFPTLRGMKGRTIYLNGFSKSFAMTGWRIGYACGPRDIIAAMTKIHQYTMLCAPIISQLAACEALKNSSSDVAAMVREYRRRRALVVDGLNQMGLECLKPDGAFYVFPSIARTGISSIEFAGALLKKEKVAVVPGTAFGPSGEGYIRISYASSYDNLKEALARIKKFLEKISASWHFLLDKRGLL